MNINSQTKDGQHQILSMLTSFLSVKSTSFIHIFLQEYIEQGNNFIEVAENEERAEKTFLETGLNR